MDTNDTYKALAVFQGNKIRKTWYNDEWWFSILDVVTALTNSIDPKGYVKDMRRRDEELSKGWGQIATPLPIQTIGGIQSTNCANTEGLFRIVQSIPSPKAESFKLWLAKVGYERVKEIENPELAQSRMRQIYKAKGYSNEWIEKRVRGIAVRDELTNEWGKRGVKENIEYAILTSEISKAIFGMTPSEYNQFKGLKTENLRDHMDDLELIFTMLGEASTTKIAKSKNALGFVENKVAALKGGKIAGDARQKLEIESNEKVVTHENYLYLPEKEKRKRLSKL